ncbi:MAG: MoaD/ThiS family protein [Thermoanaerobaculia bacterium]
MANVILPSTLKNLTGGEREIAVDGATAGEILGRLQELHPELGGWVLDERGHIREHVKVFVGDRKAELGTPVRDGDSLHVIQAISGGSSGSETEVLVGTRKGLVIVRGPRGGTMTVGKRQFPGQTVEFAVRDPRSGTYFASVTHGQFGPRLFFTDDPEGEWRQAEGPAFPSDTDTAMTRIWVVEPGEEDGVLWAGVAPAALFKSTDDGRSWSLNRPLWEVPNRAEWEGGLGGLCLHSICPWPGDPSRLAVAISAAGVWLSDDGGDSWRTGIDGLVSRYLPEEARQDTFSFCVHNMRRVPSQPDTLYMQFHGGVYRSDDAGESWVEISAGLPADFGFPIAVDPHDPDRAFVIPLRADEDRVTPDGRVRVFETRTRGASWQALENGLPQQDAHLTVRRQAFCQDGRSPLGLYFGATSGELFGSVDGGASWSTIAERLPPILSVRAFSG